MAVVIWLVRKTEFRGGKLGVMRASDELAADLINKGDALPFDSKLRQALADLKAGKKPAAKNTGAPGKRRGRPPKDEPPKEEGAPLATDRKEPPRDPGADAPAPAQPVENTGKGTTAAEKVDPAAADPKPTEKGK